MRRKTDRCHYGLAAYGASGDVDVEAYVGIVALTTSFRDP